jgi:hypothetical protein
VTTGILESRFAIGASAIAAVIVAEQAKINIIIRSSNFGSGAV